MGAEVVGGSTEPRRRWRTIEEKRRIVEEALMPGASVAQVARLHGVNANQVFAWRRQYQAGELVAASATGPKLLPVIVADSAEQDAKEESDERCGSIVSVRAMHAVPSLGLVVHWSYGRSGSGAEAAEPG